MFLLTTSLNLPARLSISNSKGSATNHYLYSADGTKLKVYKPWNNAMREQTDYVGNMIYENRALKRILVDGGYVEDGNYYFYETDYLGNNRVVMNDAGLLVQTNDYSARFMDPALGRFYCNRAFDRQPSSNGE